MTTEIGPLKQVRAIDARAVGFWAIIVGSLVGLWLTVRDLAPSVRAFPEAAGIGLVGLVLSLAAGLWLIRRLLRPVQAPLWSGSWLALAWGALAACGGVALMNQQLMAVWSRNLDLEVAGAWSAALSAPINEEVIKIVGVVLLAAASTRFIRSPVDGFVYGALVGFGFQIAENFSYVFVQVVASGAIDPVASAGQSQVIRFVLTGIGSHWAMTAVAGAGIGYLVAVTNRSAPRRVIVAAGALLVAIAMHWQFDAPLMEGEIGLVAKPLINFAVAVIVFIAVRRKFRAQWDAAVAEEVATGSVGSDEAASLSRRRTRARAVRSVSADHQKSAVQVQAAQLALIEERVAGLPSESADPWRRSVTSATGMLSSARTEEHSKSP